ncbi:ABC transporter permease [Paenibacillus sp. JNUCC31]|uniref:ABC transporter permease n=1 Tax=Paenibacillus sp. JNUCC-31 TaxID=2777983 RepID=UPI0017864CAF|nr:ABC transporter permease [Paenibacillus sp. JNUCC-31]QOS81652.1 ABC transporter permease [Paenibacillus sp. JNUCC-31]
MLGIWISELERDWKKKSKIVLFSAFLIVIISNIWGLSSSQMGVFRFGEGSILLNNLNAPWFMMDGMSLLMMAALLPIFYIDQLSGELNSGAYRLYALRPYRRFELWLGKLLALAATTVVGIGIVYIISMIGSKFFFSSSDTAALYGFKDDVGRLPAELYTIKFYGVFLLTCLAKLLFCSAICVFISRPIIAFLVIFGLSIVLYHYIATELVFLFDPFRPILVSLQSGGSISFWLYLTGASILFGAISFWGWQRKVI